MWVIEIGLNIDSGQIILIIQLLLFMGKNTSLLIQKVITCRIFVIFGTTTSFCQQRHSVAIAQAAFFSLMVCNFRLLCLAEGVPMCHWCWT